jgi:hypothetical protein
MKMLEKQRKEKLALQRALKLKLQKEEEAR